MEGVKYRVYKLQPLQLSSGTLQLWRDWQGLDYIEQVSMLHLLRIRGISYTYVRNGSIKIKAPKGGNDRNLILWETCMSYLTNYTGRQCAKQLHKELTKARQDGLLLEPKEREYHAVRQWHSLDGKPLLSSGSVMAKVEADRLINKWSAPTATDTTPSPSSPVALPSPSPVPLADETDTSSDTSSDTEEYLSDADDEQGERERPQDWEIYTAKLYVHKQTLECRCESESDMLLSLPELKLLAYGIRDEIRVKRKREELQNQLLELDKRQQERISARSRQYAVKRLRVE